VRSCKHIPSLCRQHQFRCHHKLRDKEAFLQFRPHCWDQSRIFIRNSRSPLPFSCQSFPSARSTMNRSASEFYQRWELSDPCRSMISPVPLPLTKSRPRSLSILCLTKASINSLVSFGTTRLLKLSVCHITGLMSRTSRCTVNSELVNFQH
jgi:hypothetical protein